MKKSLILVLLVLLAAIAYWQWTRQQELAVVPPPVADEPSAPAAPRYPIPPPAAPTATAAPAEPPAPEEQSAPDGAPAEAPEEPLPALGQSTALMTERLSELFGDGLRELLQVDEIVRRIVVSIDNLPQPKLNRRQFVLRPVAGPFLVAGDDDAWVISEDNAARYDAYIGLMNAVASDRLAALYVRFYPLFQEAYVELGYPDGYFNDRLVEVIDHLLATPSVETPIALVRPHVFYRYADPELEALSAGQKILLRMGSAHSGQVKSKLRELRRILTSETAAQ